VRAVALLSEPSSAAPPGACLGLLTASLCPTIFGHELVKFGLLLALFGGTREGAAATAGAGAAAAGGDAAAGDGVRGGGGGGSGSGGGMHVRSDVHVLVVGDPGLGKVRP
jgi:DNA helicase MCM8